MLIVSQFIRIRDFLFGAGHTVILRKDEQGRGYIHRLLFIFEENQNTYMHVFNHVNIFLSKMYINPLIYCSKSGTPMGPLVTNP